MNIRTVKQDWKHIMSYICIHQLLPSSLLPSPLPPSHPHRSFPPSLPPPPLSLSLIQGESPLTHPRQHRLYSHRARTHHVLFRRNDSDSNIQQLTNPQSLSSSSTHETVLHHSESLDNLSEGEVSIEANQTAVKFIKNCLTILNF